MHPHFCRTRIEATLCFATQRKTADLFQAEERGQGLGGHAAAVPIRAVDPSCANSPKR